MMDTLLNLNLWLKICYALPLVVAVSLVYSATRHEDMRPILIHAGRTAVWIIGFMAVIFAIIYAVVWWL